LKFFFFFVPFDSGYSTTPIETEISVLTEEDQSIDPSSLETNDDNDYLLALMLQHEFNNEFNGMMKNYESTVNRNSKRIRKFS
jgi:hypothetical protein